MNVGNGDIGLPRAGRDLWKPLRPLPPVKAAVKVRPRLWFLQAGQEVGEPPGAVFAEGAGERARS